MNKNALVGIAGIAGIGIIGCAVVVKTNRQRNEAAAEFLQQLEARLNPASKGIDTNNSMDQDHHKAFKTSDLLSDEDALKKAQTIADAWGKSWYNDDNEEQVYSALRTLQNPGQVSQVAEAYYQIKDEKITLIDDIKDRMSESEIETVMGIINQIEQKWQKSKTQK